MKPLVVAGLIIVLFAACKGKRYGHYGYVKRGGDKLTEKKLSTRQQFYKQPRCIASKAIVIYTYNKTGDDLPKQIVTPLLIPASTKSAEKERKASVTTAKTDGGPVEQPNKKARESLWFGLATYLVLLIPIVGVILSFAFAIVAVQRGLAALKEIDANPEKYTNAGAAVAGVALGTVLLAIFIFFLLFLMISLVGFTIPFIPFL